MKEATPRTIRLQDYQPPAYLIDSVDLDFDLREQGTRVVARFASEPQGGITDLTHFELEGRA